MAYLIKLSEKAITYDHGQFEIWLKQKGHKTFPPEGVFASQRAVSFLGQSQAGSPIDWRGSLHSIVPVRNSVRKKLWELWLGYQRRVKGNIEDIPPFPDGHGKNWSQYVQQYGRVGKMPPSNTKKPYDTLPKSFREYVEDLWGGLFLVMPKKVPVVVGNALVVCSFCGGDYYIQGGICPHCKNGMDMPVPASLGSTNLQASRLLFD